MFVSNFTELTLESNVVVQRAQGVVRSGPNEEIQLEKDSDPKSENNSIAQGISVKIVYYIMPTVDHQ